MKLTAQQKTAILIAALQNIEKILPEIDSIDDGHYSSRSPILPLIVDGVAATMFLESSLEVGGYETDGIRTHDTFEPGEIFITDVDDSDTCFFLQVDGEDIFESDFIIPLTTEVIIPMIRENNVNK